MPLLIKKPKKITRLLSRIINKDRIHIKILGTKGEIKKEAPRHKKQSGILIDEVLLLDLGEKSYLKWNPKWILITHLHPDHAYFVRRGKQEDPETEALIFAPEKSRKGIQVIRRKRKLGPYTITPIPTHHSKHVESQGYLIEKGNKSFLYTGDLVWINKKYHSLFDLVDLVITDGSFLKEGGMIIKDKETERLYGHNGIPNLIRMFQPYTKKILFTHFGSWFFSNVKTSKNKIKTLGKKYGSKILVGYDGMDIYL